jgi:hypothetical protein
VLTFREDPMEEEPAASPLEALRAEIAVLYEGLVLDAPDMPKAGPAELGRRTERSWSDSTRPGLPSPVAG